MRWYREAIARDPGYLVAQCSLALAYLELGDQDRAGFWVDRAISLGPSHQWPNVAMTLLNAYTDDRAKGLAAARRLAAISPADNSPLYVLLAYGETKEAIQRFETQFPELACSREPTVNRANLIPALNLSLAWAQSGEQDCADRILEKVLQVTAGMPRLGSWGFGIADVEVYARRGETERALTVLRQAIDSGWRAFWWAQGERSPHLTTLRADPRFAAMMEEIRADMKTQLDRVREMDRSGQLAPIP